MIGVIVVVDASTSHRVVLVGLLIAPVLLAAPTLSSRTTGRIGLLCVTIAALALLWNDNAHAWAYWVPLAVVTLGSTASWLVARLRERLAGEADRMAVLGAIGEVAHGERALGETADAIAEIVVPRLFDACFVDALGEDGPRRLAVRLARGREREARLLGEPVEPVRETRFHARAGDRLADLGLHAAIVVPLRGRGGDVGVLTLGAAGALSPEDVRYAETLAGCVALALDNAALSAGLASAERQLEAILRTVDAAITVREAVGRLVFANEAAAALLGFPDVDALRATSGEDLMDRFEVYDEQGRPLALGETPPFRLLREGTEPPPTLVRNVVRATGEEQWLLIKVTAIRDGDGRPLLAVNVVEDVTPTKRGEIAQRVLAEAGRALARAQDDEELLRALTSVAVPGLADCAAIDLADDRAGIRRAAAVGAGAAGIGAAPAAAVIASGAPELTGETLAVPLAAGGATLGALTLASTTARRFDARDLPLALDLGREAGLALRNARLHRERAEIAHTLQAELMPDRIPAIPGWEVAALYRPAGVLNEAGGDFYDVFRSASGWAVVIGDVAGKGAAAAGVTALARHTLAAVLHLTADPVLALTVLNARLAERGETSLCTVAVLILEDAGDVVVACAGHPPPLLCRDRSVTTLGEPGTVLGAIDAIDVRPTRHALRPDDQLLLYTDGVLDATGRHERFGEDRLRAAVGACGEGAPLLVAAVADALDAHQAAAQSDDIAVLALRRTAGDGDERASGARDAACV